MSDAPKPGPLTAEQAETMRRQLCEHYRDQVLPVRDVCKALLTWAGAAKEYLETYGIKFELHDVELVTCKSGLLGRLLYAGEKLRIEPCPECKGVWSGCFRECPCGGCGWLPEKAS